MGFIKIIPKKFRRSKKSSSLSRSDDPSSFSSGTTSSSESSELSLSSNHGKHVDGLKNIGSTTPTSVLRSHSSRDLWPEMPHDVYFELVHAFRLIDRDGDGKVTREDLAALLSGVGTEPLSHEELTMMLSEVDRDGDGCISFAEFGAVSSAFGPPAGHSELKDAFDVFDADHDGRITAEELFNVFTTIGDGRCTLEDCRRMISGVDKNGDGFVCFEDFALMMEQHR